MKKLLIGCGVASMMLVAILAGAAFVFAQNPMATDVDTNEQSPVYTSSIVVDDTQNEGLSEADESTALADMATITPEQAKNSALTANPGTTVVKIELDNENGAVVYSVELDNGMDVKVDAGNGDILYTDNNSDFESNDFDDDNIEHEFDGEEEHED